MNFQNPSPDQLACRPELASLAMLEVAFEIASNALHAAWPELWLEDERGPLWHHVPEEVHRILEHAPRLHRAAQRYRDLLRRLDQERFDEQTTSDGPPF